MDTASALAQIVRCSRSLMERVRVLTVPAGQPTDNYANRVFADWLESCSAGDRSHFEKRLSRVGLDLDTWHAVLTPAPTGHADLPDWAKVIESALDPVTFRISDQPGEVDSALAFAPLLRPFVTWAERRLMELDTANTGWLTANARRDLANALTETLSVISSRTLVLELNSARMANTPPSV